MDTIIIAILALLTLFLGIANYCQFLKHKIKDSHSWNDEFRDSPPKIENESAILTLLRQMKELEDKNVSDSQE